MYVKIVFFMTVYCNVSYTFMMFIEKEFIFAAVVW